jgi:hypothetical protein
VTLVATHTGAFFGNSGATYQNECKGGEHQNVLFHDYLFPSIDLFPPFNPMRAGYARGDHEPMPLFDRRPLKSR